MSYITVMATALLIRRLFYTPEERTFKHYFNVACLAVFIVYMFDLNK